jgi:DNA-directed RNA polymerase subunit F
MIAEKILKRRPVTLAEAKEMVKERLKESDAPTYEQDMTLQYVGKFAKLSRAKAEKLVEELQKIEGVDHWLAAKIADVLPQEKPVLELLLTKRYKLSEESMQSILENVKKFMK